MNTASCIVRRRAARRSASVIWGVLLWSSVDACAQLIGIEVYEEGRAIERAPGQLGSVDGGASDATAGVGAGSSSAGRAGSTQALTGSGGVLRPGDGGSEAASGGTGHGSGAGGSAGRATRAECTPEERRCMDNAVDVCTSAGEWERVEGCVDQTCSSEGGDAACSGACAPGQVTCQEGDAFECDRGEWDLADACTTTQLCRAGACVEARRDVGNATLLAETVFQPRETLLLYRLPALEHDAVLEHFGIAGDVDGVQARLVLYGDRADGVAPSGDVVARSGGLSFALAAGAIIAATPASPDVVLSAGTAYWLGVVTDAATTLRGTPGASTALRVVPFAPFNAAFGPAEAGQLGPRDHLNVFIGVRELP